MAAYANFALTSQIVQPGSIYGPNAAQVAVELEHGPLWRVSQISGQPSQPGCTQPVYLSPGQVPDVSPAQIVL